MDENKSGPWGQRGSGGTKSADEKFCHECGAIIRAKAEICPHCGVRQSAPAAGPFAPNRKSRVAAALFGVLLGGLGMHHFYLGHIGLGILYLVFCWTIVPAIVGIIEGLIYLSMSDAAFSAKYDAQATAW